MISQKHIAKAQDSEAESRIDYLADILGLSKREVISVVERMRQEGILADSKDISAYLQDIGDSERKSQILLERFAKLEQYIPVSYTHLDVYKRQSLSTLHVTISNHVCKVGLLNSARFFFILKNKSPQIW